MSYLTRRSYSTQAPTSTSPSKAIEDSKKKTSLLKDNSWIRRDVEEDEPVDRDPNFGRTILSQYKSNENLDSSAPEETKSPKARTPSSSVHALTKRFSTSQDELNKSSTLPSSHTTSYTRSTSLKSDAPKTTTTSKTVVTEEPKKSTTTTTITKGGKTTETTTTTTTQRVSSSPVIKTPPKTETFTERVFSDVKSSSKGITPYSSYSPTKTTKVTETTVVTSNKEAEDQLYDKLLPKSITDDFPATDSKTNVSKTETVKTSTDGDGFTITRTTRTSSTAEDELYDTLLPKSMTSDLPSPVSTTSITRSEVVTVDSAGGGDSPTAASPTSPRTITSYSSHRSSDDTPSTRTTSYTISSKPSDDYTSTRRSYTSRPDSSYEYSSPTSPTVYNTTSYKNSSADDRLADPYLSASSIKTVYSAPERTVLEKDLCTYCHKPFNSEAKMILEDMKINCHASCFKCEECKGTLGHLKAGDSMWIYRHSVQCESCFSVTREKWRR